MHSHRRGKALNGRNEEMYGGRFENFDVVPKFPTSCGVEWVDAEDPLFLLAYFIQLEDKWCTQLQHLNMHLTTRTLMFTGAQLTVVGLQDTAPDYPDPGRCWDIVNKYKVTIFYTAPTLRPLGYYFASFMLIFDTHLHNFHGFKYVTHYLGKSLRVLGSVGEPINPTSCRCPISDTWWQTETDYSLPGAWPQKPGSATFPFFGVQPVIEDEKGVELDGECNGYLCVKSSWPGAFRTLYGDHERYETTYFKPFPGYYFTGDGCRRDKDGYHWLTGRVDDVINVSGHRIGTAEVESALVSHPHCAEAAVVGVEHKVKGQSIYAFVTPVEGISYSDELRESLILTVRNQIGAFAAPDKIHWAPGLPKTRSGKIMRRILRKIASRQLDELGDTSTLADPGVVDQLIELADV
ncbi:Acetyl-coenzyme A synthetase [Hibiscus syriacus]|uniref:acetate--CoA ligase n=1 Tax=Hibiscus syriacus TaxID=106335 RepID=A0A6A3AWP3_HIBSY|nr:Acetyl-coenzyme A synthetase [Hibiscus syriacus]